VIDGRTLLLGSANWAGTSIPKVTVPGKYKKGNREWLVRVDDAGLARSFAAIFQADWGIPPLPGPAGAPRPLQAPGEAAGQALEAVAVPDQVFDIAAPDLGNGVDVTPILSPDNYFKLVRKLIRGAQASIDLEQQYIIAGGPKTQGLLDDLAERKDHVQIRILV